MARPSPRISVPVALAAVTLAYSPAQAQRSAAPPPGFDAYVAQVLRAAFSVPGDQVKMVPASPEVDFSFDFQDLLLRPVGEAGAPRP
jgi:hypothetical protein